MWRCEYFYWNALKVADERLIDYLYGEPWNVEKIDILSNMKDHLGVLLFSYISSLEY